MVDDPDSPSPKRVPKYKAPDFMQKEVELFLRARNATVLMRRNGNDDAPIARVSPVNATHAIRGVSEINRQVR